MVTVVCLAILSMTDSCRCVGETVFSYLPCQCVQATLNFSSSSLENGVLHSTIPYTLESELQNVPPPTYSISSRHPVYI